MRPLHLRGGVYFRCDFRAPWGMRIKPTPVAEFHLIVRGQCWLQLATRRQPVALHGGDIVVLPHGDGHALLDSPKSRAVPAERIVGGQSLDRYGPVVYGGKGLPAEILCGYFEFERAPRQTLLAALPPLIHVRGADSDALASLQAVMALISRETRNPQPGGAAIVDRLAEVLFIQILRAYIASAEAPSGIFAAIADRQIGAALAQLRSAPEKPWSVASLAKQVAMSRSAFSARFTQLVGQPPMRYLAERRMERARELLAQPGMNAAAVAGKVGYGSEAAFGKAFKKIFGTGPGAFRRRSQRPG